ncbi:MAG: SEC-C domain-containing protein [Sulfuricurvum sp.]|jgi:SEC-C motif-containing protein|uniref:YchJ family protein n=1 Tax=Sulfuricurvum sp. TaxID=2025608 RepID=UPI0025D0236F|nr:YchJ family metal-binding protein [Sulfuricurvum sp.]MCK9372728.1 SEC-C domain-containing protein [Sulfuricurvum sp.]
MKISPNAPCPCHSGDKYKKCCHPYHKGILPSNALKLMRSRYSAFALSLPEYIMDTTHPNNGDYSDDRAAWARSILAFSRTHDFTGLKILDFIDGESVAYVTFSAVLGEGSFIEKSRFYKIDKKWLYESGEFPES